MTIVILKFCAHLCVAKSPSHACIDGPLRKGPRPRLIVPGKVLHAMRLT